MASALHRNLDGKPFASAATKGIVAYGRSILMRMYRGLKEPYDPSRGTKEVVLLSFKDWARLERGELSLPAGWGSAGELQKIA